MAESPRKIASHRIATAARIKHTPRQMQTETNRRCYAFFWPRILAMIASSEKAPGPKINTMSAVSRN